MKFGREVRPVGGKWGSPWAAGDIIGFACCVREELDTAGAVVGHRVDLYVGV